MRGTVLVAKEILRAGEIKAGFWDIRNWAEAMEPKEGPWRVPQTSSRVIGNLHLED